MEGTGCSLGKGHEQVCQEDEEPVLGSALPRIQVKLKAGRGEVSRRREGSMGEWNTDLPA